MAYNKNRRGLYCEALTGEVFAALSDIISPDVPDAVFLKAQEIVNSIFLREYVEKENQL